MGDMLTYEELAEMYLAGDISEDEFDYLASLD